MLSLSELVGRAGNVLHVGPLISGRYFFGAVQVGQGHLVVVVVPARHFQLEKHYIYMFGWPQSWLLAHALCVFVCAHDTAGANPHTRTHSDNNLLLYETISLPKQSLQHRTNCAKKAFTRSRCLSPIILSIVENNLFQTGTDGSHYIRGF